jgi:pimeloyl-ACP methyl ester carboxylesterase
VKNRKKIYSIFVPLALLFCLSISFWLRPVDYSIGFNDSRDFLSGFQSQSVQVSGYRMHYLVKGPIDGQPVVLVHGLGGHGEDWLNLAPYLTRAGYRVYMPDLVGFGRSEKPVGFSYAVHDQARLILGFMDALHLSQVDLAGWSMGGAVVQHVALRQPQRIRTLILIDAIGLNVKPAWNTSLFAPTTPSELDQLEALLMPNPPTIPSFIARDILRVSRERSWVIHRSLDQMLTGQDATDALLPQLKMPVLIVWGSLDHIIPLEQGETMHQLVPKSQLEVFFGCGHLAPVQCADRIGPKLVDFVHR